LITYKFATEKAFEMGPDFGALDNVFRGDCRWLAKLMTGFDVCRVLDYGMTGSADST
jgi:hypothetical protein